METSHTYKPALIGGDTIVTLSDDGIHRQKRTDEASMGWDEIEAVRYLEGRGRYGAGMELHFRSTSGETLRLFRNDPNEADIEDSDIAFAELVLECFKWLSQKRPDLVVSLEQPKLFKWIFFLCGVLLLLVFIALTVVGILMVPDDFATGLAALFAGFAISATLMINYNPFKPPVTKSAYEMWTDLSN